jgi:hypothetical protein
MMWSKAAKRLIDELAGGDFGFMSRIFSEAMRQAQTRGRGAVVSMRDVRRAYDEVTCPE